MRATVDTFDAEDAFWTAPRVIRAVTQDESGFRSAFDSMTLRSAFQPIVSVSQRHIIGFEGLLRADGQTLDAVPPCDVFDAATAAGKIVQLDRVAHAVHMNNFAGQTQSGRLFLNIHPGVFEIKARAGNPIIELATALGLPAPRIVLEILETPWQGKQFASAAKFYRDNGFLLAIDDFCSVQSNLHRVWEIKPDFVKLDRSLVIRAAQSDCHYRVVAQIVDMLHQSGAMVIAEGVESIEEALPMIDMDVDYLQGNYFGVPGDSFLDEVYAHAEQRMHYVWNHYPRYKARAHAELKDFLSPYRQAFLKGIAQFRKASSSLVEAMDDFLGLAGAIQVYSLDRKGVQRLPAIVARRNQPVRQNDFGRVRDNTGADMSRKNFIRKAASRSDKLVITGPGRSPSHALNCYTLAVKIHSPDFRGFLCGELIGR